MTDEELDAPSYLIVKRGYYYRPNEQRYTSSAIQAGRYTLTEAEKITHPNGADGPRDGMTFIHEDEVNDEDWKAYTTLSAQLAEALEKERQWIEKMVDAEARADRAEAALAAQIEVDAWQPIETAPKGGLIDIWLKEGRRWCDCYYDAICDEWRTSRPTGRLISIKATHVSHWISGPASPAQPRDRTALDRHDAKTREKALREAATEAERTGTCLLPSGHFLSERCRDAILALIEKGKTE